MNYGFPNHLRVYFGYDQSRSSPENYASTTPGEGKDVSRNNEKTNEQQELKKMTEEIYEKYINAKTKIEAQTILDGYSNEIFMRSIGSQFGVNDNKLATNVRILELFLKAIFDKKGDNKILTPKILSDIQRAIGISILDTKKNDFYSGARENNGINSLGYPVTTVTLANALTTIITAKDGEVYNIEPIGGSVESKIERLKIYYDTYAPDNRKDQFSTMIQIARNILINNNPSGRVNTPKMDIFGTNNGQSKIPGKKINLLGGKDTIVGPPTSDESSDNTLQQQLVFSAILQAGGESMDNNAVLGGADVLGEYKKINKESPETRKLLDSWNPETMYALFFLRMSEFIKDNKSTVDPKAMIGAFKNGVIGEKLDAYPEIKKIYTGVFEKMTLFVNSGVIDSVKGREAIQKIGSKFSETGEGSLEQLTGDMNDPEFVSLKNEIEKSLATKEGGFGLDKNNVLKFYSVGKIRSIIIDDDWDSGKSMAVKGYLNSNDDFGGINQIFTQQSEKDAFFIYYTNLDSDKKNQLISPNRQAQFDTYIQLQSSEMANDYIADKKSPSKTSTENKRIPIADPSLGLSEQEQGYMKTLLMKAGYNEEYLPLKNNQLDVAYILRQIMEGKKDTNYRTTKEDIDKVGNLLGFFEKGLQKKGEEMMKNLKANPDISKDPIIQKLFTSLKIENNSIEEFRARLSEKTNVQIKEIYNGLLNPNPTATLEVRKQLAKFVQNEIDVRMMVAQRQALSYQEGVLGKDVEKVFITSTNSVQSARDIKIIKDQIHISIGNIPAEITAKYGLPDTLEGYLQKPGIENTLENILADPSIDPKVKIHIRNILDHIVAITQHEKVIVQNADVIQKMGYGQVVERFSAQYSVLQDIPPHRLAQYQMELGIVPGTGSLQGDGPTNFGALLSRTPYPASEFREFQGLTHISQDAMITKTDSGFSVQIAATDTRKIYKIEDIKNKEELQEKMRDADTLAQMKMYSLMPQIDLISTLISQNNRLQSLGGNGDDGSQRKNQLVSAVELLLGQESVSGRSLQDRIQSIYLDTSSSAIHQTLVTRGVFDDGGTPQREIIKSYIREESIRIENMTDSQLINTFIGPERKGYILSLTEIERTDLIANIQAGILRFREIYGEINSRTLEQYKRALSDAMPNTLEAN